MTTDLEGRLLVASPSMPDPDFEGAVVLVIHQAEGAVGIVLNMPTDLPVADHLPDWAPLADPPLVFSGGPVQPAIATIIAETDDGVATMPIDGDRKQVRRVRVFGGYAGWEKGQLEDEIDKGDWLVVPSEPDDPFAADAGGLWQQVLRRQTGSARLLAEFPVNPSLN